MMYYDHGMNGWGYGLMMFGMLLVWALLIAAGVALFRYLARTQPHHAAPPPPPPAPAARERTDPEQLLAERLARGEIEPDEYRQRLDALRAGRPGPG
ncbi:SHOCT domain-containing protein [Kitasatospora sp. NPDC048365]|uniref:SHOCT domain-containing protein n=1 Tax=Kitasatospora sp. NPDC048365 TaxID=3364050 RepID=UPI0037220CA4